MEDDPKNELDGARLVQQHLANERTFLAWIRTGIAIIGLGFLAAGVVFQTDALGSRGHLIASIGGIGSVVMGCTVILLAALDYFRKRQSIRELRFRTPLFLIWFVCVSLACIGVLLILLVLLMLNA